MSTIALRGAVRTREFSEAEERVHSLSHGLGAVLALPASAALVASALRRGDALDVAGNAVFGATLAMMFAASSVFHGLREPRAKGFMQTVDNDAIYLLIAGTYTPFCLTALRGGSGPLVLGIVWALAAIGVTIRTAFPGRFRFPALACYLAMGWLIAPFFGELRAAIPPGAFALLVAGGVSYSVGAVVYAIERVPWFHALWHLFVLGGAGCHLLSVLALSGA